MQALLLMAKTRVPIPDDLAAEVMFASDRTCCICRDPSRKTEIHHIDSDPSNNGFANLAVVCKDHQSEAHTNHAFARNLTRDIVRKYNESWRAIVRARLSLDGDQALNIEYQQQVLLQICLAPHAWKVHYVTLYPGHFRGSGYDSAEHDGDVWDLLSEVAEHRYSINEWRKYLPLFDDAIQSVASRLDSLLSAHGEVVPVSIKLAVLRTSSQLDVERSVYRQLPHTISMFGDENRAFTARFKETIKPLSSLARIADNERKALEPDI
jgi:hypothetical protein